MLAFLATAAGLIGFKWVFRNLFSSMVESVDNFILRAILNFLLPGIIALPMLVAANFVSCTALANILILAAIILGDLMGLIMVQFAAAFLPVPDIGWIIGILLVLAILQLIIPLLLPGLGSLIALIIAIAQVFVLAGLVQANLSGLKECGSFMIPGLGIGLGT